jgi:hypothetical protein
VALARGAGQEAERLAGEALEGYGELEDRLNQTRCRLVIARARILTGDREGAASALVEAGKDAARLGNTLALADLDGARAELALLEEDREAARTNAAALCSRAQKSGLASLTKACTALRARLL